MDDIMVSVGDSVLCHTPVIMSESGNRKTTIGKTYEVMTIRGDKFTIINDDNEIHYFSISINRYNSRQWFRFPQEGLIKTYVKRITL